MSVSTPKLRPKHSFHIDQTLLTACLCLLGIGFVMVASSSMHLGVKMADDVNSWYTLFWV